MGRYALHRSNYLHGQSANNWPTPRPVLAPTTEPPGPNTPEWIRFSHMLEHRRAMGSPGNAAFVRRFLTTGLAEDLQDPARSAVDLSLVNGPTTDAFGNVHVFVRHAQDQPQPGVPSEMPYVLWSAHHDDVSHPSDSTTPRKLAYAAATHTFTLAESDPVWDCLGADNVAGCYILLTMIRAGVPGYYVFHHGEERGCVGSTALVNLVKSLDEDARYIGPLTPSRHPVDMWLPVRQLVAAIAFDRREYTSIITHQSGDRTCSEPFAAALATLLGPNVYAQPYTADDGGAYTDTIQYTDVITECTNVSAGTHHEHAPYGAVDWAYVHALATRMARLAQPGHDDFAATLHAASDPANARDTYEDYGHYSYVAYRKGWDAWDAWDERDAAQPDKHKPTQGQYPASARRGWQATARDRLIELCESDPELVAAYLDAHGVSTDDVHVWEQETLENEGH